MEISPYLNFNGNCAEAFKFYEQCLGGRIVGMQTHGASPMKDHVAGDWHEKVLHARLVVGDQVLMGSDVPPDRYSPTQGIVVQSSLGWSTPNRPDRFALRRAKMV